MKLFLDTGAFIAREKSDDKYHRAALTTFSDISAGRLPYRRFYTSNFVLNETVTLLLYRSGPTAAKEVLKRMRASPNLRILHVTSEVEGRADELFERFAQSRVSYTDCTSKALMEQESIDTAFSFDRDFRVLGCKVIP